MSVYRTPWQQSDGGVGAFAPEIIVGNVPAGDSAVAQAAPFQYIPDPGDGSGIAAALAAAGAMGGAWVHLRRGTYTLDPAVLPLALAANTRLTGAGAATVLVQDDLDRRVATLANFAEILDLAVQCTTAVKASTGIAMIDASGATHARVQRVRVLGAGPAANLDEPLRGIVSLGQSCFAFDLVMTGVDFLGQGPAQLALILCGPTAGNARVASCSLQGGDFSVRVGDGVATPIGCTIHDNVINGSLGGVAQIAGIRVEGASHLVHHNRIFFADVGILHGGSLGSVHGNLFASSGVRAIELEAASANLVVTDNVLGSGATAVVLDAGTNNELSHNF